MELTKSKLKQTEVGLIAHDWKVFTLKSLLVENPKYGIGAAAIEFNYDSYTYLRITDIDESGRIIKSGLKSVEHAECENYILDEGELVFARTGASVGKSYLYNKADGVLVYAGFLIKVKPDRRLLDPNYLKDYVKTKNYWNWLTVNSMRSGQPGINSNELGTLLIPLPPTLTEQKAIATALSDVDDLIANLDKLITKKKAIKQGAMQQLLTPPHKGGKRLAGFTGEWIFKSIEEITDCLDNLRVPLNGEQRAKMKGDIPYCGANGIVDYVDDFVINDDIILMAEDGGYFDEYKTRPIAYRIVGKCWVNNHAHILKSKEGYSQDFLFYSLVHKNILDYINGGTRAKLNKGEMSKIELWLPVTSEEQHEISLILNDIDLEIEKLETKKVKYQDIKQGMMQELLTGKTRLV